MPYRPYFSDYGRASRPSGPQVLPYLVVAALAFGGIFLLHNGSGVIPVNPPAVLSLSGTLLDANTGVPLTGIVIGARDASAPGAIQLAQETGSSPPIDATGTITVAGATTNALTPPPAVQAPAPAITATTSTAGTFFFASLPPNPVLVIRQDGYAPLEVPVAGRASIEIRLTPNTIRGTVTSTDGKPVGGALVVAGDARTLTGADGAYLLRDITPDPQGYSLVVKAPGYLAGRARLAQTGIQNISVEPFAARAVYVSADTVADPTRFAALLALADKSEINAMVIDIKKDTDGFVLYDTKVSDVIGIGAVNPIIPNLDALLQTLHDHHIYAIARLPLFWDEKLAQARPDWAIRSKSKGGLWTDAYGHHWTNPRRPEVWAYNLAIAVEAAQRGFDEIQFDYVRFPSDGNLSDADYGPTTLNDSTRSQVIAQFLAKAQAALSPLGTFVAADVFGLTPIVNDDQGIGQKFEDIADQVDFICPMAYPSHYADGFMSFPHPAEHPAEVVGLTLQAAQAKLAGRHARLRPWLQDFTLYGITYDVTRVRAEIDTADVMGTLGWMLWNYDNTYTVGALHAAQ